jgi:hypothetical protein
MRCWLMSKGIRRYSPLTYLAVLSVPVILSCFTSCKKDSGLGSNVLPSSDILGTNFVDTSTVITSIRLRDSILTTSSALYQVGSYNDPVFGMTKASIYTQVVLPNDNASFSFGTGPFILDSVVLAIPFNNTGPALYGTSDPQTFIVDTIAPAGALQTNKAYYSDTTVTCGTKHIGMATIVPNLTGSGTMHYGINNLLSYPPELRIKLDPNFGNYIMNANPAYFTSTTFTSLLKGLRISVSNPVQLPGQGGILSLTPYLLGAGLIFYYRIGTDTVNPQVFQIGSGCAYFLHYDHDYTTTPFYVKGKDSVLSPNVAYVQAAAGIKTQISFPFLSNWKNLGPIIVNLAEVEIPVNENATGSDIPPAQAYLVRDSAGHSFSLVDQGLATYGGVYDAFNHRYLFDIARYVQSVLDGKMVDRGLYLVAGNTAITANGAVLYGGAKNTGSPRIRLKMFYTPLKH